MTDRPVADREPLSAADRALAVPHRDDDQLCGCDECMAYGAEDEGFDWYRVNPARRIVLRVLDSGDDRLAPIADAFREHEQADAALAEPAVPVAGAVHINDGSAERDAMAWSKGHTAGFDEGAAGLRQAISVLENYGDHHEWCTDKTGGDHCPCRFRDEITALRPAQPEDDGLDEPNWLGALILHAELVHGCDHTDQVRAESNALPALRAATEARSGVDDVDALREALRVRHERVCSCPFDGTDPDCNLAISAALLGALMSMTPASMDRDATDALLNDPNRPTAGPIDAFMRSPATTQPERRDP